MSRQNPISFNRQPLEKKRLEEKLKRDIKAFKEAGGKIYKARPDEHSKGKLERWEHFVLPGSPRD